MNKVLLLGALLWVGAAAWAETPHHLWAALEQAFNAQSWTETAELGTKFLETYPDDPQAGPACFLRGMALLRSGHPEQALGSFQKAARLVSSGPLTQRLPFWEGYAAYKAGLYSTAVTAWEHQTKLNQDSDLTAQAWFYLGLARQKLGEPSAVLAWTKFLDQPRADQLKPQALIRLGDFLVKQQPEQAQNAWERLLRDYPHSSLAPDAALRVAPLLASKRPGQEASLLEQVWKNHPDRAGELLPVLIDTEQRQTHWARAAYFARAYLKGELPSSVRQKVWADLAWLQTQLREDSALSWEKATQGPDEELAAKAELSWALAKEASGQRSEAAVGCYRWAEEHSQAPTEALLWNCVRLWREQERWEHAQKALKLLLRRYPRSSQVPTYLLEQAKLAQQLGDSSQVLQICQQLGTSYSSTPQAHEGLYLMGMVYLNRGEPLRAEGYFYTLMERLGNGQPSQESANPEQKDLYWRALLARGMAFLDGGKNDLAQASLKRLINESPEGPWTGAAWSALGAVLFREARYDQASEAYAKAVAHLTLPEQLPDQEKAAWYQAQALSTGQLWAKAAPAYAGFVKTYPESSHRQEALFLEGLCLARQGKPQQALEVWTPELTSRSPTLPADWWEEAAVADLQLGHEAQAWQRLEQMADLYHKTPEVVAELFNHWAQTAQTLGKAEEAAKAYSYVVVHYPQTKAAEIALPQAAGALVQPGGDLHQAFARYAQYFHTYGRTIEAVSVLKAACLQMSRATPQGFAQFYKIAKTWPLSPEAETELELQWWISRIDVDSSEALTALAKLAGTAPWASQRSEALRAAGLWALRQQKYDQARAFLKAASRLGDDLSIFQARLALSDLAEQQGQPETAARLLESAVRQSGEGVPQAFRLKALQSALSLWKKLNRPDEVTRVRAQISQVKASS